jgi:hypothetical protein
MLRWTWNWLMARFRKWLSSKANYPASKASIKGSRVKWKCKTRNWGASSWVWRSKSRYSEKRRPTLTSPSDKWLLPCRIRSVLWIRSRRWSRLDLLHPSQTCLQISQMALEAPSRGDWQATWRAWSIEEASQLWPTTGTGRHLVDSGLYHQPMWILRDRSPRHWEIWKSFSLAMKTYLRAMILSKWHHSRETSIHMTWQDRLRGFCSSRHFTFAKETRPMESNQ